MFNKQEIKSELESNNNNANKSFVDYLVSSATEDSDYDDGDAPAHATSSNRRYKRKKFLGEGAFARAYMFEREVDGQTCVVIKGKNQTTLTTPNELKNPKRKFKSSQHVDHKSHTGEFYKQGEPASSRWNKSVKTTNEVQQSNDQSKSNSKFSLEKRSDEVKSNDGKNEPSTDFFSSSVGFSESENDSRDRPSEKKDPVLFEAKNKTLFFHEVYPEKITRFFETTKEHGSYRLVVPLMPGKIYKEIPIRDHLSMLEICLSTGKTLRNCHQKKYVFIDLKADNILLDETTGKSNLIDGGLAVFKDETLCFEQPTQERIIAARKRSQHMAPECFTLKGGKPLVAHESADIYSFGRLMLYLLEKNQYKFPEIEQLARYCLCLTPENRPNLDQIEVSLYIILFYFLNKVEFNMQKPEDQIRNDCDIWSTKLNNILSQLDDYTIKNIDIACQKGSNGAALGGTDELIHKIQDKIIEFKELYQKDKEFNQLMNMPDDKDTHSLHVSDKEEVLSPLVILTDDNKENEIDSKAKTNQFKKPKNNYFFSPTSSPFFESSQSPSLPSI